MTNIAILNRQTHRHLRVHAEPSAKLGDNQRFVAVVVNEFPLLVPHYPILLSKDAETGSFYCGAMLGFDTGENLFAPEEGTRADAYRPLNLQRGPFYTAGSELAVDLDHPRIATGSSGQPLFDDTGEPTKYLQSIMELMRELRPGLERTKIFIETLMQHKLVEPVDINVGFDDGSSRQIEGLYVIDQEALRNLPDAIVVELFRRGYLHLIYLMIASLKQIPVLGQKKNRRLLGETDQIAPRVG
ncbi:MAG: SapC family protein [Steroidobacter sp.]